MNESPLVLRQTHKPSPFAFPIMVSRFREKLTSEKLADRVRKMQLEFDKAAPPEDEFADDNAPGGNVIPGAPGIQLKLLP